MNRLLLVFGIISCSYEVILKVCLGSTLSYYSYTTFDKTFHKDIDFQIDISDHQFDEHISKALIYSCTSLRGLAVMCFNFGYIKKTMCRTSN